VVVAPGVVVPPGGVGLPGGGRAVSVPVGVVPAGVVPVGVVAVGVLPPVEDLVGSVPAGAGKCLAFDNLCLLRLGRFGWPARVEGPTERRSPLLIEGACAEDEVVLCSETTRAEPWK
jgi:hypothetical protein